MLPEHGRSGEDLLGELGRLREGDLPVRGGRVAAYVYDPGRPHVREVAHRAYLEMLEVNGLDPTVFPSTVELERQVVSAVAEVLGGDAATPGIFTSGGTESIVLALKAARDTRDSAAQDEVVVPVTAHPAFHKAAHYLGLRTVGVPVDPNTLRARTEAVAAALGPRTLLVVASAPSYPHGVLDPVAGIAALAAEHGVACHVDACVGGWVLPWLEPGRVAPFDLSVPGVTSLSCDLHKYGYAPKGASVVLFARQELRRAAYFASADWPGYTVVNSTVQSSKGAGPLAGAWATLQALGASGYRELAREAMTATRRLIAGIADLPELRVLGGGPDAPLVALAGEGVDVFALSEAMAARGWFLQPQLSYAGIPANLHLTLTGVSAHGVEDLLEALSASVEEVRGVRPDGVTELVELVRGLDLAELDDAGFAGLLSSLGVGGAGGEGGSGGSGMAAVNAVLDALDPPTREALLVRFLAALNSPHTGAGG
ncbi:aspartate aminotransferase family protein [Nocardiopsis sp. HNM0947]|uniref:Aspartate aminotransferase family protein n=1 Tax=Nocardiopsis coralli TaxID=2772213 RepID=A0ABR9PE35_9ACTN|nr:aspartate aminotransferase family protein [Nocardiopsis coralli]MBE3002112.1 aspartate aminotransferase family protein [Nocardiopsis coralli]